MRTRWRPARIVASLFVLFGALGSATLDGLPAHGATATMEKVGDLAAATSEAVVPDSASKRLLVFGKDSLVGGNNIAVVRSFDANTLAEVGRLPLAGYTNALQGRGALVYAWDQPSRRLFLLVNGPLLAPTIIVIEAGERVLGAYPVPNGVFPAGVTIQGMSYYAPLQKLYVAGQDPNGSVAAGTVHVNELDAASAKPSWSQPYAVPSCQKLVTYFRQAAVVRSASRPELYIGCGTGTLLYTPQPGGSPGVAVIDVRTPAQPTTTVYPVPGGYADGESAYDAEGDRFIMVSRGPGVPAQSAWVFDQGRRVFVGGITAGNNNIYGFGVATTGGRMYVPVDTSTSTKALLVGSDRGLKIPQAVAFPNNRLATGTVTPVPFNRTVVVAEQDPNGSTHTRVYRIDVDDYIPAVAPDPDAGTSDLADGPGVASTFNADAKAFGIRTHDVAGVNGMLVNLVYFRADWWDFLQRQSQPSFPTAPPGAPAPPSTPPTPTVKDGDRDVYSSRLIQGRLSQIEATASAVTTDADGNTRTDYATASAGAAWPYKSAECADFGSGAAPSTAPGASVSCAAKGAEVTLSATNDGQGVALTDGTPLLSSGRSVAKSTLRRTGAAGTIVETEALAEDVTIAGVARFGEIRSKATSTAFGRSGTATASYVREFRDVTMPGFSCGTAPGQAKCDPREVAENLRAVLGPRFEVELPAEEIIASPGGARGAALRDPWQHQQDIVLNNQAEAELQVPALRVIYINDNVARSRVVLEFAATLADSGYRRFSLGTGTPFDLEQFVAGSALEALPDFDDTSSTLETTLVEGEEAAPAGGAPTDPALGDLASAADRRGLVRGHGLRLLLSGGAVLLGALLWSLLVLPGFLAGRRRYLLRVIGSTK